MFGIDVSNNNGTIDWRKVAADGVDFAWVKATEGRTFIDRYFTPNLLGARQAGVAVGAYHYARPDNNSPEQEADHFLRVYRALPGDLLPVLDFETKARLSPAEMTGWAKRWMQLVKDGLHCDVVFYSYPYFIGGTMGGAAALKRERLWLADYGPNDGRRHRQGYHFPIFDQVAHQYTSNGHVGGINGRVDLNYAKTLPLIAAKTKKTRLAGPSPKPKWFWVALKQFLSRRKLSRRKAA